LGIRKKINAKDFVKDLSNRNDALIFLGGLEFKAFSKPNHKVG
jgi:hypothetical protein